MSKRIYFQIYFFHLLSKQFAFFAYIIRVTKIYNLSVLEGAKEKRHLHHFSNAICKKQKHRVCFMMLCHKNATKDKHRVSSSLFCVECHLFTYLTKYNKIINNALSYA